MRSANCCGRSHRITKIRNSFRSRPWTSVSLATLSKGQLSLELMLFQAPSHHLFFFAKQSRPLGVTSLWNDGLHKSDEPPREDRLLAEEEAMNSHQAQLSSSHSPIELLKRVRKGQPQQLGALLEIYRNYLYLLADSQLDRKLRARSSPSDIVQDTMLEAHRDFHQFRGGSEGEFIRWLRQILVNNLSRSIQMHVLAEKRDIRREVPLEQLHASFERSTVRLRAVFDGREESPSSNASRRERAVLLADIMRRLPPDHRNVLLLRNMQGLRFDEVATQMERSVPAAKMLWIRAIKQLRTRLNQRETG